MLALGGYDADLPPTHMILGNIPEHKQKYHFNLVVTLSVPVCHGVVTTKIARSRDLGTDLSNS